MVLRILIYFLFVTAALSQKLINKIEIEGNVAFSDNRIKNILFSVEGEELLNYKLNRDLRLIENLYKRNGYIEVEVRFEIKPFSVENDQQIDNVFFTIKENFQSKFGNLNIQGNQNAPIETLNSFYDGKEGDPYSVEKIKVLLEQIRDFYKNRGFPNIEIELQTPSRVNDNFTKDILINIKENNIVYFRNVYFITPADSIPLVTDISLVKGEIEFNKGDLYNEEKLRESQKYLYELNLFQNVSISFDLDKNNDTNIDSMDVIIELTERKLSYVGLSAGLTTDYGLSYSLNNQKSENFFKKLTYEANFDAGKRNWKGTGAEIGLGINPVFYFNDNSEFANFSNQFRVYSNFLNFPFHRFHSFLEFSILNIDHPDLGQFDRWNVNYRTTLKLGLRSFLDFTISNDVNEIGSSGSGQTLDIDDRRRLGLTDNNIFSIGSSYRIDERDDQINPKAGYNVLASVKASVTSGLEKDSKDVSYYTTQIEWRRYQRVLGNKDLTFASNLRMGAIFSTDESKNNFDLIPIFDRYYMGSSLRGFKYNQFGNLIPTVDATSSDTVFTAKGGRAIFVSNFELRYKLTQFFENDFYLQSFIDFGGLWEDFSDVDFNSMRLTYGLGASYFLKVLVIRFDYGFIADPGYLNIEPTTDIPSLKKRKEDTGARGEYSFGLSFHF